MTTIPSGTVRQGATPPGGQTPIQIVQPKKTNNTKDSMSSLTGTFDQFLNLLTTQLKHQDPLSPMDSAKFTNQLVSFANVEQAINSNLKLDSLIKLQTGQQKLNAISLIGKEVQAVGERAVLKDGKVKWQYNLPQDADRVRIEVKDQRGNVVFQADSGNPGLNRLRTQAGPHVFEWDGVKSIGGRAVDGEAYTMIVRATGQGGAPVEGVTSNIYGLVSGVTTAGQSTRLIVDGKISVGLDTLISVKTPSSDAPAQATAPATATGDDSSTSDSSDGDSSTSDSNGGDSSGGDSSTSDSSGGDSSTSDSNGGDSSTSDSNGGDSSTSDSNGGDSSGGDSSTSDSNGGGQANNEQNE